MEPTNIDDYRNKGCNSFELIMEFIDHSPSFAHGFEMGCLWSNLKSFFDKKENMRTEPILINDQNTEQVKLIAESLNLYIYENYNISSGWKEFTFQRMGIAP